MLSCALGVWRSMHIDDLRDTEDMSLDLSAFCGASMSELMSQSLPNPGRPTVPLVKHHSKPIGHVDMYV